MLDAASRPCNGDQFFHRPICRPATAMGKLLDESSTTGVPRNTNGQRFSPSHVKAVLAHDVFNAFMP
jgi:hypothetical protein